MSVSFEEFLVATERLAPRTLLVIEESQRRSRPRLGELAVRKGWLTWSQVLTIVLVVRERGERFGEAAIRRGLMDEDQVDLLVREQEAATPSLESCILERRLLTAEELALAREEFRAGQVQAGHLQTAGA